MSIEAIKMNFRGGLHIGRGAEELDKTATSYGSDTLKSALFSVGLSYYPEWETDEKLFFEGFRISSAFPFCGSNFFLPKPVGMTFLFSSNDDLTEAKKAKKISYVSSEIFSKWVEEPGEKIKVDEDMVGDSAFLFSGKAEAKKFLYTTIQQRVAVPAAGSGDTKPFYFERLFFSEGSGMYFLIEFIDESLRPKIMHALDLLSDAGIGTDRTVGNGQFTYEKPKTFSIPDSNRQGLKMALGLYLPTKDELSKIQMEESVWSVIKRGGYMAAAGQDDLRSLRKNSIYFFGEGSAFKTTQTIKGRYIDLKPDYNAPLHPVWRCGMPVFINL